MDLETLVSDPCGIIGRSSSTLCRGCITPFQLQNIAAAIDGDFDLLDGYDEMPEVEQQMIAKALEDGHVSDDVWRGVGFAIAHDMFIV